MHVGFVVYAGEFDELCAVGAGMLLDLAEKLPAESLVLIPGEDDDLLQPIARKVVVGLEIPDREAGRVLRVILLDQTEGIFDRDDLADPSAGFFVCSAAGFVLVIIVHVQPRDPVHIGRGHFFVDHRFPLCSGRSEISRLEQKREAGVDLFVGEEGAVVGLDDGGFRRKLQMPGLLQRGEGVGGGTAADKVPHGGDAAAGLQIPDEACHGAVVPRGGLLRVLQQLLLQGKLEFGLFCFHRRILSAC